MTWDVANRLPVRKPAGYDREEFSGVIPLLSEGRLKGIFGSTTPHIYKAQIPPLPHENGTSTTCRTASCASRYPVKMRVAGRRNQRTALLPSGFGQGARDDLCRALFSCKRTRRCRRSFATKRARAAGAKTNCIASGGLPKQLYVREARGMKGAYVFTEKDTDYAAGDARAVLHRDAIAIGDYGPNSHGTGHEGSRFGGRHTGELYKPVAAYQIPYGVLVPRRATNLLAPGPVSSSHVGFCALRLEPIWMSLGQAAGHAAHQARVASAPVQKITVPALQKRQHSAGAATFYVSDVPRTHPDFAAVQCVAVERESGTCIFPALSRSAASLKASMLASTSYTKFCKWSASRNGGGRLAL